LHGHERAYLYLKDGESESGALTYAQLHHAAMRLAARLGEHVQAGDRALLVYPTGLEFVTAFWACLYAGIVAVPSAASPDGSSRGLSRLAAIAQDAGASAVLTTSAFLESATESLHLPALATDHALNDVGNEPLFMPPSANDLAFLQYTSGSTGAPKGVMVTHANLVANEQMIFDACRHEDRVLFVGWLPLFHDMGLIGNMLHPVFAGGQAVLLSPIAFLRRPLRWLRAITTYRATVSGGPNFAYDLCVAALRGTQDDSLDLSSWRAAFSGAEPVRAATLRRFTDSFQYAGFNRRSWFPSYGLAEATLFVSGTHGRDPLILTANSVSLEAGAAVSAPEGVQGREIVSCGPGVLDERIRIVDADRREPRALDTVGEVWVAGPHIAAGYWQRPEETARDFGAYLADGDGPYLRTGDLGFVRDGELYIAGRSKDVIIVRGRNLFPHDIEATAEVADPRLRPGCSAAFSLDDGQERVIVVQEVARQFIGHDLTGIAPAIVMAVSTEHGVGLDAVVLVKPGNVPKTSSGKVQRSLCRRQWLRDELSVVQIWINPLWKPPVVRTRNDADATAG
jgi:acyl-CoA synthetase (AMP-forming)/AMP-acid ligase II